MRHLILSIALLMGIASSGQDVTMNFPNAVFDTALWVVISDIATPEYRDPTPSGVVYLPYLSPQAPRLREHIDLAVDYGLTPARGKVRVQSETATNTIAKAAAAYPSAYGRLKAIGWTDDRFMLLSVPAAMWIDAVWQGHEAPWTQTCMSRTNIDMPHGDYWFNVEGDICMGRYRGAGTHTGYNRGQASTTIHVWKDAWIGNDPHEMNAFRSTSWGLEGNAAWVHGFHISGFGFVGNNAGWYDPSYTESGLALWDAAESSEVSSVWSVDHNGYGIKVVRGTPTNFTGTTSVFTNALGGVVWFDGELGTLNMNVVSGDDNGYGLIVQDTKYGRGAGGNLRVNLIKAESGKRVPNKGSVVLVQKAPCVGTITIGTVQMAVDYVDVNAAFVVNNRAWGQTIKVGGFLGWNFRALVHDVSNRKQWGWASFKPASFTYCSRDGGTVRDDVTGTLLASTANAATGPMGFVSVGGTFDYAKGTPLYTSGTPTTPPPGPVDPPPGPVDPPPPTAKPYTVTTSLPQHSSYEGIAAAVDGNLSTRWTSGRYPTVNDWITIDMGAGARWKTITLDATGSAADYLTGIQVSVSTNGTSWSKLNTGTTINAVYGTITTLTSSTWRTNRYIRIQPTVVGSKWWSIHEITVE